MTLEQLNKRRNERLKQLKQYRYIIRIGLTTCGLASGAQKIFDSFKQSLSDLKINDVLVEHVGCIGECPYEPIVEIYSDKNEVTTYAKVQEKDVLEIINEHLEKGQIVEKKLLSKFKK